MSIKKILGAATLLAAFPCAINVSATNSSFIPFVEVQIDYAPFSYGEMAQSFNFTTKATAAGKLTAVEEIQHNVTIRSNDAERAHWANAVGASIGAGFKKAITDMISAGVIINIGSDFWSRAYNLEDDKKLDIEVEEDENFAGFGFGEADVDYEDKNKAVIDFGYDKQFIYAKVGDQTVDFVQDANNEKQWTGSLAQAKGTLIDGKNVQSVVDAAFSSNLVEKMFVANLSDDNKKKVVSILAGKNLNSAKGISDVATNNITTSGNSGTPNATTLAFNIDINGNLISAVNPTTVHNTSSVLFALGTAGLGVSGSAGGANNIPLATFLTAGATDTANDFISFADNDANGIKSNKISDNTKFLKALTGSDTLAGITGLKANDVILNQKGGANMMDAKFVDFNRLFTVLNEQGVKISEKDLAGMGIADKDAHYLVFAKENNVMVSKVYKGGNALLIGKTVSLADFAPAGTSTMINDSTYSIDQTMEISDVKTRRLFKTDINGFVEFQMNPAISLMLGGGFSYAYNKSSAKLNYTSQGSVDAKALDAKALALRQYTTADLTADRFNFAVTLDENTYKPQTVTSATDKVTVESPSGSFDLVGYSHSVGGNVFAKLGYTPAQMKDLTLFLGLHAHMYHQSQTKYKTKKDETNVNITGENVEREKALTALLGISIGARMAIK